MVFPEKEYELKDGRICRLRSTGPEDAHNMIEYMKNVFSESHFLTRYPDEVFFSIEEERKINTDYRDSVNKLMMIGLLNGRIISQFNLHSVADRLKIRHRGAFGITVRKEFWGLGIGNIMMYELIENSRKMKYEQMELDVYSDNENAIRLYEKYGFEIWGRIPDGYKLKDGTYRDCIKMGRKL